MNEQTYIGKYDSNSHGYGFVAVDGFARDLFIPQGCSHGAVFGDTVEVKILRGELDEYGLDDGRGRRAEAEVVRIVKRGLSEIVGTYRSYRKPVQKQYYLEEAAKETAAGKKWRSAIVTRNIAGFVVPDHARIPFRVDIPVKDRNGALEGHKVVTKITLYNGDGSDPVGEITEILGHITDPGVDILSLVRSYGIPTEFPEEVTREAEKIPDSVDAGAYKNRKDLRAIPTVTIDGDDTKDIDDAISLVREGDRLVLGVHIADVAEYVKEGSALDREVLNRGTSVYLADRVIPMLPRKLSNGICSLNAGEDRLALSCLMTIDESGDVAEYEIAESVIHVDARLSYNGVMRFFTEKDESEIAASLAWQGYKGVKGRTQVIARMLRRMKKLASVLRAKREKRGCVDFDFPEAKVVLDENGKPVEIVLRERNDATDLIEDFMILANETVAKHCVFMEIPSVYRIHGEPVLDKMRELTTVLRGFGYKFHPGQGQIHPSQIRNLLQKMEGKPEETMLSMMVLRCMQKAQYATSCEGHFGLALSYYCHFTSPIRRYPDLLVHRSLKYWIHGELDEAAIDRLNQYLPGAAARSSETEQRAAEAERETIKLKKAQFMEDKVGETYTGVISGITSWGIYVELPNTVEGMIRISDLTDDFYEYDEKQYILVGERTGRRYMLGQKIRVTVEGADDVRRTIDFVPAKDAKREDSRKDAYRSDSRKGPKNKRAGNTGVRIKGIKGKAGNKNFYKKSGVKRKGRKGRR